MMRQFGIFAKYWEPGRVKTRLAATLGAAPASEVYRAFLDCLLERFAATADRRVLAYTPAEREAEFAQLAAGRFELESQSTGDLGERMQAYFAQARQSGSERTVLIGSDSPSLPAPYVELAFERLADTPCVLGPSRDGGYYLLGLSGELPPIFAGLPWSTDRLLELTRARLEAAGCSWSELPEWYDVDDAEDLAELRRELGQAVDDAALARLAGRLSEP